MGRPRHEFEGDLRVVSLKDVEYFVDWSRVVLGSSFFIPTVATAIQVREALQPIERHLKMKLTVRTRVEYGRYGVRVWRIG
jgi:hypothetical protein